MANTIKNVVVNYTAKEAVVYFTLVDVAAAQETNTVVYDSSAVATLIQNINPAFVDPLKSRILEVYASCNAASTARVDLLWDATTKVEALNIPVSTNPTKANFRKFGGLVNQGGAGITGNILITTTGLAAADTITLVLTVGAY